MARTRFGRNVVEDTQADAPVVEFNDGVEVGAVPTQDESTEGSDVQVTDVVEQEQVEATEDSKAEGAKRAPRPAISLGNVITRKSERTDFTTRATPTESNPVYLAVKNAEIDTPTDILVENTPDKISGAISILRRAAAPKMLNVGMHIAPKGAEGYPTENVDGVEYAVITFKTSAERQVRGKKSEVAAAE